MADGLPAVLAIDGGNSKTDVALIGWDGTVLAAVRGPGASHEDYGIDGATYVAFPDVVRAIQEADQNAVDLAVARARTTIERSGTLIAQQ